MAAGFSFRVAKGVRIRVSSRGVRTSVGPRAARVHFGSGRTGVSTGAGPVGFYTSLGGGRRGSGRSSSLASYQRSMAQADKATQARQLNDTFQHILNVHRAEFAPAQHPIAALMPVDESAIRSRHEKDALAGIGIFKRSDRAAAKQAAAAAAEQEIATEKQRVRDEQAEVQALLDEAWERLCANDPDVVLPLLEEAFEDNEAPAAAVGVEGDEAELVVLVPGLDMVPERIPASTQAGNLTLKKVPKGQRSAFYTVLVCGQLLATLREAFAVAPGINAARAVVLRSSGPDSYGQPRVECLMAARFTRKAFDGIRWSDASAAEIVDDTSTEMVVNFKGQAKEIQPLDLTSQPELAALVAQLDLAELTSGA